MSRTKALFDLQTLDTQLAQVTARMARVEQLLHEDRTVAAARNEVALATAQQDEVSKALRSLQDERNALKDHIAREERRLYGGQVRVPKELQGLQLEVTSLKRRLARLDDSALETMLAKDAADEHLALARAAAADAEARAVAANRTLGEERARLERARQRLEGVRRQAAEDIPAPDLAEYERLLQRHGGRAVAQLRGDSCGGCGMQVARHMADRVRADTDLIGCGHCGRLLFAGADTS